MKVLIIEDEYPAAERLKRLLNEVDEYAEVVDCLESIKQVLNWFEHHSPPDIILSDIQLADGISFEIFDKLKVSVPVIFTTSYDEYAIEAFKVQSIDYLLKPIKKEELSRALRKYQSFAFKASDQQEKLDELLESVKSIQARFKKKFLIHYKDRLETVPVEEIAYFITRSESVYLVTVAGKQFVIDYKMEKLEQVLAPSFFFRINRQTIIHQQSIASIYTYFNNRLKLVLKPQTETEIIVSRDRVRSFKKWMEEE
jgi:DNA-binding LytR/AlgR family response regulator